MAPIFNDPNRAADQLIVPYGPYKPYSWHKNEGGDAANYPAYSGLILDLKEGKAHAVKSFAELIEPDLGQGFSIAVVPSHDPAKQSAGLVQLAATLAAHGNRVDASGCLVRIEKIEKLAHGGDRRMEVHFRTREVWNPHLIQGQDVLLIDDVTRTGNSLFACRQLLLNAGARHVQCVALGRTG